MSCVCRNPLSKDSRNQRKPRPTGTFRDDRPNTSTYMGSIILMEQCDMFIRFQNKTNISYPAGGPGRHKNQPKDPHQGQDRQIGKPPIPEAMWSVDLQRRQNRGLRGPGTRLPGLPRAARPNIPVSGENTRSTDVQEGSEAIHRRSVARWDNPRPASLGWAARPHLAASRLPTSHGS